MRSHRRHRRRRAPRRGSADTAGRPVIRPVSILEGIRERRAGGPRDVRTGAGPGRVTRVRRRYRPSASRSGSAGTRARARAASTSTTTGSTATPRIVRTDPRHRLRVDAQFARPRHSVRLVLGALDRRRLTVPPEGVPQLGVEGNDGYRLWRRRQARHRQLGEAVVRRAPRAACNCARGQRARYPPRVLREHRQRPREAGLGRRGARRLAARASTARWRPRAPSDVAVVVAGVEEGEFRDRALLEPAGPPGGADRARGRDGEAGRRRARRRERDHDVAVARSRGRSARRVVSGRGGRARRGRRPLRRLRTRGPAADHVPDAPKASCRSYYDHKPTGRGDDYVDLTGQPLFPVRLRPELHDVRVFRAGHHAGEIAAEEWRGDLSSHQVGTRAGDEVVQLYIRDVLAAWRGR